MLARMLAIAEFICALTVTDFPSGFQRIFWFVLVQFTLAKGVTVWLGWTVC